jgi:CelD/BcsL family acetyltransferase involved in cellulose biosynthesis
VGGLRIITVRDVTGFGPHREAWDRLAWEAPQGLPTQLPAWVEAGIASTSWQKERWFCSFAYRGDRLVAVLPIVAVPHPVLGMGWPILHAFDKHARTVDILLAPDHAETTLRALLAELQREAPTHSGLDLKAVRQHSPFWALAENGLDGYVMRNGARVQYSFLDVSGDHEAYLASLGNMRRNLKRYAKKLESRGTVSVQILRGPSARADFLAEFLALEASGWKGREATAIANRPDLASFYTEMIPNFASKERLEWHTLRVDGRLVAAGVALRYGPSLYLPKIAYDEDFAECMPGSLLTAAVIRDAFFRPEIQELNHMSDADWHHAWRMDRDSYVDVHLVRSTMLPMLIHLPHIQGQAVYRDYVRPRIPNAIRIGWRWWKQLRRQGRFRIR